MSGFLYVCACLWHSGNRDFLSFCSSLTVHVPPLTESIRATTRAAWWTKENRDELYWNILQFADESHCTTRTSTNSASHAFLPTFIMVNPNLTHVRWLSKLKMMWNFWCQIAHFIQLWSIFICVKIFSHWHAKHVTNQRWMLHRNLQPGNTVLDLWPPKSNQFILELKWIFVLHLKRFL